MASHLGNPKRTSANKPIRADGIKCLGPVKCQSDEGLIPRTPCIIRHSAYYEHCLSTSPPSSNESQIELAKEDRSSFFPFFKNNFPLFVTQFFSWFAKLPIAHVHELLHELLRTRVPTATHFACTHARHGLSRSSVAGRWRVQFSPVQGHFPWRAGGRDADASFAPSMVANVRQKGSSCSTAQSCVVEGGLRWERAHFLLIWLFLIFHHKPPSIHHPSFILHHSEELFPN